MFSRSAKAPVSFDYSSARWSMWRLEISMGRHSKAIPLQKLHIIPKEIVCSMIRTNYTQEDTTIHLAMCMWLRFVQYEISLPRFSSFLFTWLWVDGHQLYLAEINFPLVFEEILFGVERTSWLRDAQNLLLSSCYAQFLVSPWLCAQGRAVLACADLDF